MANRRVVDPVKLFVAELWSDAEAIEAANQELTSHWGSLDYVGKDHPFDLTDYYQPEMGPHLMRRLVSFVALVGSETIAQAKLFCNELEDKLSCGGRRRVNLDIGYLDHHKVVLASVKGAGHKIHLGHGVFADLVARYREGKYQPFEWTFMDFRDGRYDQELLDIRGRYMEQLRATKKP